MKDKNKKEIWKKITASYVLVTLWNFGAFTYHFWWLGIGSWTSILIQIIALLTDYIVSNTYEWAIIKYNNEINQKTKYSQRIFIKYGTFLAIFTAIYVSLYFIRVYFFYLIGWGINGHQFENAMINTAMVIIISPVFGLIVIMQRKRRKRKERVQKFWDRNRNWNWIIISSSVWEGLFLIKNYW